MQVKLLRAIQERAVRPVGAHAEEPVDVRILSASHQDLGRLVAEGRFRQDLFFRINVITLRVPPLRERREDIPDLAAHILARLAAREGGAPRRLSSAALRDPASLRFSPATCASWRTCSSAPARSARARRSVRTTSAWRGIAARSPRRAAPERGDTGPGSAEAGEGQDEVERLRIIRALEQTRWNARRRAHAGHGLAPAALSAAEVGDGVGRRPAGGSCSGNADVTAAFAPAGAPTWGQTSSRPLRVRALSAGRGGWRGGLRVDAGEWASRMTS